MTDTLDNLLPELVERTKADAWFDGIEVLSEDRSDVFTKVRQGLGYLSGGNGKAGAAIVWLEPQLEEMSPNMPFGPLRINVTALVLYDQALAMNGSHGVGVKPMAICRRLRTLKFFQAAGLAGPLELGSPFQRPTAFEIEGIEAPTLVAYECRFTCREADGDVLARAAMPSLTLAGGQAAMACGTAGAEIYYTLDGSYPRRGNSAAALYSGPVAVSAGTVVRAAAYVAGGVPSLVNQAAA